MRVRLIWVGKTKERFAREAVDKYLRLSEPFASLVSVEVKQERGGDRATVLRREGERILKVTSDFVLLGEEGRQLTSEEFAGLLSKKPRWDFVVGGPFGVSDQVRHRAESTV
ncbi:MAG: 23S rRNA (pseudouridine(1915)-N(3))-methyltransferase RlmH, partial [Thermodesulfovibrionales bacterium]